MGATAASTILPSRAGSESDGGVWLKQNGESMNIIVRMKNKAFWMTFIPAVFIAVQLVLTGMGVEVDLTEVQHDLLELVNAIFAVLAVLGVAIDPTTAGVADSERAMGYTKPWDDLEEK